MPTHSVKSTMTTSFHRACCKQKPNRPSSFSEVTVITLVNTQNVSVNKIVDYPSIQCVESKYDPKIQFLALVLMINEMCLNT